jgi:hypothetical protein
MDAGELEQVFGIEIEAGASPPEEHRGPVPPEPAAAARAPARGAPSAPASAARRLKRRRAGLPGKKAAARAGRPAGNGAANGPAANGAARVRRAAGPSRAEHTAARPSANGALELRLAGLQAFFRESDFLTNSDYRRLFPLEVLAASRELGELTARGVLIRSGYTRGTKYRPGPALGRS